MKFGRRFSLLALALLAVTLAGTALQMIDSPLDVSRPYVAPKGYVCYRTPEPLHIDGKLDKPAWLAVPWTDYFVDIEGDAKPAPRFRTRAKMLWDDNYFYIGAELEEPHVWATLTQHDTVIFQDNDFEVFIDPNGDNHEYYEFEINALNTGWDLFLPKPYKDGGSALNGWEIPGLKTAVHIEGTLNSATDIDRGWTVEMAFPWHALAEQAHRPTPPREDDQWRVNFSRVEWRHEIDRGKYRRVAGKREDNWVWSPQHVIDMHRPGNLGLCAVHESTRGHHHIPARSGGVGAAALAHDLLCSASISPPAPALGSNSPRVGTGPLAPFIPG